MQPVRRRSPGRHRAFRPFVPGPQTFNRVVVGGKAQIGDNLSAERKNFTYDSVAKGTSYRLPVYEYTLQIEMGDNTAECFFGAENEARDMTNQDGSEAAAEVLGYVPSDTVIGEGHLEVSARRRRRRTWDRFGPGSHPACMS